MNVNTEDLRVMPDVTLPTQCCGELQTWWRTSASVSYASGMEGLGYWEGHMADVVEYGV